MKIILASQSPRRKELLQLIVEDFEIKPSHAEEDMTQDLEFGKLVEVLSYDKAKDVFDHNQDALVLGFDTIVVCDKEVMGKPLDDCDAIRMLNKLSNNEHSVYTGCTIMTKEKEVSFYEETKVYFKKITTEEISEYLNTNEHKDKAGAYGIQGKAAKFIKGIKGDYYTVMGMPVHRVYEYLKEFI